MSPTPRRRNDKRTSPAMGIRVTKVNMADLDELRAAITPTTRLVYAETPCNHCCGSPTSQRWRRSRMQPEQSWRWTPHSRLLSPHVQSLLVPTMSSIPDQVSGRNTVTPIGGRSSVRRTSLPHARKFAIRTGGFSRPLMPGSSCAAWRHSHSGCEPTPKADQVARYLEAHRWLRV